MTRVTSIYLVVILTSALTIPSTTNAQSDLRAKVMERQALMKSMLKSYFPLLAVYKGKNTDLAKAAESARNLNDQMTKSLELFVEGTAKDQVPGSRAKPEVWSMSSEFGKAAELLTSSISGLIELSESGDIEGFKAQFQVLEQACIGCHEFKPSGGGKFRFGK